ncbi:MAG: stage III sporulation protein AA [Lachnospiraceae bacterium]|nr:stage III sporulation protein AA [Lachnospiraceae bacterium]
MSVEIEKIFPADIRPLFAEVLKKGEMLEEIRIRLEKPLMISGYGKEYFIREDGSLTLYPEEGYRVRKGDLHRLMEHFTRYSPYAFEAELREGFLSLPGGHRIGVTGEVVCTEEGRVKTLKNISSINIRIARYVQGVAEGLLPFVYENGHPCSLLLVSPPGCGKTTMLRDFIRLYSEGNTFGQGRNVGVADERMEIAGSYMGQAGMPLGARTDVLSGCSKTEGVLMLIRSMNPGVIAVDEIGREEEIRLLRYAATCGITLLNTIHGQDMQDLQNKESFLGEGWLSIYDRIIFLKKDGGRFGVRSLWKKDEEGEWLCVRY